MEGTGAGRLGEWVLRLSSAQIDELDAALRAVQERSIPLLKITSGDFPLPTLAGELEHIADVLENGRGFVLVKGIPVERYNQAAAGTVFWGVGRHLGTPVSQNASGHMLGHARDTGRSLTDPATRGYQTARVCRFTATAATPSDCCACERPAPARRTPSSARQRSTTPSWSGGRIWSSGCTAPFLRSPGGAGPR
ncbi:hypothetical protein LNW71_35260 [Streptomyces sp. RKAG290]|nr:hypothetical protein [Streptomyces sp. RKAG290]MCM2416427.1 hypothetical protein [Streptomyces sp. RKAG290]